MERLTPDAEILPVGTKVRALVDIHDEASGRKVPQHAKVGDTGIIAGYHGGDDVPTIDWGAGTGFGVYDSPLTEVEKVVDAQA